MPAHSCAPRRTSCVSTLRLSCLVKIRAGVWCNSWVNANDYHLAEQLTAAVLLTACSFENQYENTSGPNTAAYKGRVQSKSKTQKCHVTVEERLQQQSRRLGYTTFGYRSLWGQNSLSWLTISRLTLFQIFVIARTLSWCYQEVIRILED